MLRGNTARNPQLFRVQLQKAVRRTVYAVLGCAALTFAAPVRAEAPVLDVPLDCRLGETCWLVNLVDRDPSSGHTDFRCGGFSYDTHKGTDIAIADDAAMRRGVAVLAAAPGRVLRMRDGVPDNAAEGGRIQSGQDCGNGVVIAHDDNWSTQYCHMKAGSISVSTGQTVARGAYLGDIGRSGRTEFPHLHITVRHGNAVIDPFTGDTQVGLCNRQAETAGLWSEDARRALVYPGPQPYHLGFAEAVPEIQAVRGGTLAATHFAVTAPVLVFWVEVFTLQAGDKITIALRGPDGSTVGEHVETLAKPLARKFNFVGRKRRGTAWTPGQYEGRVEVSRNGVSVIRTATATVE